MVSDSDLSANRPAPSAQKMGDDFLFEHINDAILIHDLAGNLLRVNPAACQRLGYTRAELLRLNLAQLDSPANALRYAERIRQLQTDGHLVLESEHRRKDGTWLPVEVNARLIQWEGAPAVLGVVRDITRRKRAEENYRHLFENAVEGIFQSTPDGRYLRVNAAMARIYGYGSVEEMLASVGGDIEHKVYAEPGWRAEFIRLMAERGWIQNFQAPNRRKDGTLIWTNTNARAVQDSAGAWYYEGFVEDVTEQRRTLEALRKSEERFAAQYKGIPLPTYTWKKLEQDFVLINYNDAAYKITNGKITQLLRRTAQELYPAEPTIQADLAKCFYDRTTLQREIKMQLYSAGALSDLIMTYTFIPPDLVMVHTEDITQRKQAETALRDSEARYRMLMEQAADGILLVDSDSRIINTNSMASTLLGYTRDELLQMRIADILVPGSLEHAPIPFEALRQGKTVVIERMMQRKNATVVPVEVRTKMLPDGTFQGILRDISERKQLEKTLQGMLNVQRQWNVELENKVRAKTAELQQLSETRDQLLRQIIVAQEEEHRRIARELHDETSQALTALLANLAVVHGLPAPKVKAQLAEVKASIVEILKGVNQIVLDLRPTLLDDYGLMPALSWYANKRLGSSMRVEIIAPEPELRLPSTIETTLFRIGQEALTNSAKHAQASCVRMTLAGTPDGKHITLQVEDDGIGFRADLLGRQEQTDRSHFGLLGMQERVQLIGGQLRIETAPDQGTRISASVSLNNPLIEE